MKRPSDSSAGREPWAPPPASGGGGSSEPAKKQRRTSSSSSQPPPQQPVDARQVPELGEDVMFEVLRRAEARTLAAAACVSRAWRILAQDERLWVAACVREWAGLGFSEQLLRAVVLPLGGFRRLHAVSVQARQRFGRGCGKWHGVRTPGPERKRGVPWTEDEYKLYLLGLKNYGRGTGGTFRATSCRRGRRRRWPATRRSTSSGSAQGRAPPRASTTSPQFT